MKITMGPGPHKEGRTPRFLGLGARLAPRNFTVKFERKEIILFIFPIEGLWVLMRVAGP